MKKCNFPAYDSREICSIIRQLHGKSESKEKISDFEEIRGFCALRQPRNEVKNPNFPAYDSREICSIIRRLHGKSESKEKFSDFEEIRVVHPEDRTNSVGLCPDRVGRAPRLGSFRN